MAESDTPHAHSSVQRQAETETQRATVRCITAHRFSCLAALVMAAALITPPAVLARPGADPRAEGGSPATLADLGIAVTWVGRPEGNPLMIVGKHLRFDVERRRGHGGAAPLLSIKLYRYAVNGEKIVEERQRIRAGTVRFWLRKPGRHVVVMQAGRAHSSFSVVAFRKSYPARVRLTVGHAYPGQHGVSVTVTNPGPWTYEVGSLSVFQLQAGGWIGLRERSQPDLLVPAVMRYIKPGEIGGSYALLEEPLIPGRYRAEWFGRSATGPEFEEMPSVEFGVGTEPDPCATAPCPVPATDGPL